MSMREDYQALMEKQLNEWKAQTERFKASAGQFEAQAKAQFDKNLELLRAKQAEAWEHFHKLKIANEAAWAQFKTHVDAAGAEVKAAVERMTRTHKP
jgi:5-methylcytosine-specific restriction endonuclease McrBC regulatory subunit McrC